MSTAYWIAGNALDVLRKMPDGYVDLAITSPPFLALRSYLPTDDPAKVHEIGAEATPGEFIDTLLDITEELRRVVAPHGSIAIELGDTYSGSGGAGGDYNDGGLRDGQPKFKSQRKDSGRSTDVATDWPEPKSLTLIPELFRTALAYGINPLTGRTTPRWRVRNVIRWTRPNPPVGRLGDKFRPSTSDMVIACGTDNAGRDRYFDLDAVRTKLTEPGRTFSPKEDHNPTHGPPTGRPFQQNEIGAPPRDWWDPTEDELELWDQWVDQMWRIPTVPYQGSHHATWPPALVVRPIKAMCPTRVCLECGQPSRRIVELDDPPDDGRVRDPERLADSGSGRHGDRTSTARTIGWTDCGHDAWRPGRVLDPFGGSGTTLAVATGHARDAIGIDLDVRNTELARNRIGPMFFQEITVDELI